MFKRIFYLEILTIRAIFADNLSRFARHQLINASRNATFYQAFIAASKRTGMLWCHCLKERLVWTTRDKKRRNNMAAAERILQLQVEGLQNLEACLKENSIKKRKFVMFIGAIDESGDSWCSDCRDGKSSIVRFSLVYFFNYSHSFLKNTCKFRLSNYCLR